MQVYLYSKSGHAIGLDATRRCSALAKLLQEQKCDPILCTSDFRAGAYAKEELGIKKYVSVDILSNLPNIMQRGDILIYDSDEASDFMENHMKDFCTLIYKISDDIPLTIVDKDFFKPQSNQNIEKLFFFGDDDYDNWFLNICLESKKQDISLQLGHYFFLGNEKKLKPFFNEIYEEEEYINSIQNSKYLLSGSLNACIESISCGNKAVLLRRPDKKYDEELIEKLNIPVILENNLEDIISKFNLIIASYPQISAIEIFNVNSIIEEISMRIKKVKKT